MKIVAKYSHLAGLEFLAVRNKTLWKEIQDALRLLKANRHETQKRGQEAREARTDRNALFANAAFVSQLTSKGWNMTVNIRSSGRAEWGSQRRSERFRTHNRNKVISFEGPISYCSFAFMKDRVVLELRFTISQVDVSDMFSNALALYASDKIDVGIEVLPMKSLQRQMSSGPAYYEGELYNVLRNGRGVPAVPLVIIGIAP